MVRELLGRRFDVVIVVWALVLMLVWTWVTATRAAGADVQWGSPAHGPVWVVSTDPALP